MKIVVIGVYDRMTVGRGKALLLAELAGTGHEIEYRQIGKTVGEPDLVWYDEYTRLVEPIKIKPSKGPRDRWGKVK